MPCAFSLEDDLCQSINMYNVVSDIYIAMQWCHLQVEPATYVRLLLIRTLSLLGKLGNTLA